MPSEQRIGRHNGRDIGQYFSAQSFGPHRQATTLIVVEAQRSRSELLAENSVFLTPIVDHLLLLVIHPSRRGDQQQPKGVETLRHPRRLAFSFIRTINPSIPNPCVFT